MRTLSSGAVEAVTTPEAALHLLWIAEISHPAFDAPFRIANSLIDVSHDGDVYAGVGFNFSEPPDDEDGARSGEIIIGNPDRFLTPSIRGADYRMTITLKLVSCTSESTSPPEYDEIEIAYPALALEDITLTDTTLRASVQPEQFKNEAWPRDTFNPFDFRSL
jgi:hypothetical protein